MLKVANEVDGRLNLVKWRSFLASYRRLLCVSLRCRVGRMLLMSTLLRLFLVITLVLTSCGRCCLLCFGRLEFRRVTNRLIIGMLALVLGLMISWVAGRL